MLSNYRVQLIVRSPPSPSRPGPNPPIIIPPTGSLNVDGDFITTANLSSTLNTIHGVWGWDALQYAPTPGWGIGPFHRATLNGQLVGPGLLFGSWQKLIMAYGGNVYGITFDQLFYLWGGGQWQPNNNSTGVIDPPSALPIPPTLPNLFAGPYTPSPDGTTIAGGIGTVTTAEGVWTFGSVNGPGWNLMRNGQPIFFNDTYDVPVGVIQMVVHSNGHLFYQRVDDANWYMFASHQQNPSAPTAPGFPVPIAMGFNPPRGTLSAAAPAGTFITQPFIFMSDGSPFAGTKTVSLDSFGLQVAIASGLNVVKGPADITSLIGLATFMTVTATQNGTSFSAILIVAITA
jgi:hypothetical protein